MGCLQGAERTLKDDQWRTFTDDCRSYRAPLVPLKMHTCMFVTYEQKSHGKFVAFTWLSCCCGCLECEIHHLLEKTEINIPETHTEELSLSGVFKTQRCSNTTSFLTGVKKSLQPDALLCLLSRRNGPHL